MHQKLGDLKQLFHCSGSQKSKVRCWLHHVFSEGRGGPIEHLSWFLVLLARLGMLACLHHSVHVCLSLLLMTQVLAD